MSYFGLVESHKVRRGWTGSVIELGIVRDDGTAFRSDVEQKVFADDDRTKTWKWVEGRETDVVDKGGDEEAPEDRVQLLVQNRVRRVSGVESCP